MPILRNCLTCGEEFETRIHTVKIGQGKFCSRECAWASMRGKPSSNKGRKHSAESRKRMCEAKRNKYFGKTHNSWKGGRHKSSGGYILIYSPNHPFKSANNRVLEHRIIVEKHLGRFLKPSEKVHHLNEIKTDNCPTNLICFISHSAHRRFHKNPLNVKPEEIIFDGRL